MPTSNPSRLALVVTFVLLGSGITALDLWSKKAAFELLKVVEVGEPPRVLTQERYVVVPQWFELEANYNYGAFSGWFSQHTGWLAVLSGVALVVIAGIFFYQFRFPGEPGKLFTVSLGLLWGGTCGNLYDRAKLAAVRDWIKWFYVSADGKEHVWPNFNVADSAICTGVGILILLELLRPKKKLVGESAATAVAAQTPVNG